MSDRLHACDHVVAFAREHPWALTDGMREIVATILVRRVMGEHATEQEISAALVNRKNLPQPIEGGSVAIIPIYGVIAPRMNMLSDMSGGTTFEQMNAQLRDAANNKAIKTIVLDVDSPGGNVAGATEFAHAVMRVRAKKAIVAQVQYLAGSAAYWAIAGATEIVAAPSATVGAVGIYAMHEDLSEARAKLGIKREYLSAGEGKTDGLDGPLSDETKAQIQTVINAAYKTFVGDIVSGRGKGLTADRVRTEWKAHVYAVDEARSNGMIDGIATLDETLARLLGGNHPFTSHPSATDTTQEPATATVQDRRLIDAQRHELEMLSL